MKESLTPSSWNERYATGNTPWDLNSSTPELLHIQKKLQPHSHVLIPGAGRAHDAIALAKAGFSVTALDYAPLAIAALQAEAQGQGLNISSVVEDFFAYMPNAAFDYIWEYTFYCAIDPSLRPAYRKKMFSLLKPGGVLFGLYFPLDGRSGGPPFAVTREELEEFRDLFQVEFQTPIASIKPRAGKEILAFFTRPK